VIAVLAKAVVAARNVLRDTFGATGLLFSRPGINCFLLMFLVNGYGDGTFAEAILLFVSFLEETSDFSEVGAFFNRSHSFR
jgi:hypothetical protein